MLFRVALAEWSAFVRRIEAGECEVPRFCMGEVESFLRCGILAHGFARVHCGDCGADDAVTFSCKDCAFIVPVARDGRCGELLSAVPAHSCQMMLRAGTEMQTRSKRPRGVLAWLAYAI